MNAEINRLRMFYEDRSSTDPTGAIVFLHGFPFNYSMWRHQLDFFSMTHRCIAPDLRGYGGSSRPASDGPWTMTSFVEDIVALLHHLGLQKADICGLSMGGYIAFALYRSYPNRVNRLILVDTKATADSDEAKANRYKQIDLVKQKGPSALADVMLPKLLAPENLDTVGLEVRYMIESTDAETIMATLPALAERPDSQDVLGTISVPTLIAVGEKDALTPPSDAQFMHDCIHGSRRLAVIPGAGHMSPLENPTVFNAELERFLMRDRL